MPPTASFTVYIDDAPPPTIAPVAKPVGRGPRLTRSLSESAVLGNSNSSFDGCRVDKENVHPITGEQARSIAALFKCAKDGGPVTEGKVALGALTKKRKTGVLEAKTIPPSKKAKATGGPGRKPLKRAVSMPPGLDINSLSAPVASSQPTKPKVKARKASAARLGSCLAPVHEELEDIAEVTRLVTVPDDGARREMLQAELDARCYDLTVSPLADVSEAYDHFLSRLPAVSESSSQLPPMVTPSSPVRTPTHTEFPRDRRSCAPSPSSPSYTPSASRTWTALPVPSDSPPEPLAPVQSDACSSPSHSPRARPSLVHVHSSPAKLENRVREGSTFSTPERNEIYSAFTFHSPSPTSARYRATRKGGVDAGMDVFGDIEFKFV